MRIRPAVRLIEARPRTSGRQLPGCFVASVLAGVPVAALLWVWFISVSLSCTGENTGCQPVPAQQGATAWHLLHNLTEAVTVSTCASEQAGHRRQTTSSKTPRPFPPLAQR